jgi:hypothetical protein
MPLTREMIKCPKSLNEFEVETSLFIDLGDERVSECK